MSEFATSKINVIKPAPRWGWGRPKAGIPESPFDSAQGKQGKGLVWVAVGTVILAIIAIVGAYVLYQRRSVVPTPGKAATTTVVEDNFDGTTGLDLAKWTTPVQGTAIQSNGKLTVTGGTAYYINQITGDFSVEVNVDTVGGGGSAGLTFDHNGTVAGPKITRSVDQVVSIYGGNQNSANLAGGSLTTVRLKMQRVGNIAQTFYDEGTGYQLLGTYLSVDVIDGRLGLVADISGVFENFLAGINIFGQPTPIPGTAGACRVSFNVLDLQATPTPTATPTATPIPTATPTPTNTPTPLPTATGTPQPPTPTPTLVPTLTPTPTLLPNQCQQLEIVRAGQVIQPSQIRRGDSITFRGHATGGNVTQIRFTVTKDGVVLPAVDVTAVSEGTSAWKAELVLTIDASRYKVGITPITQ